MAERIEHHGFAGSSRQCAHAGAGVVFDAGKAYIVCEHCGRRERLYLCIEEFEAEASVRGAGASHAPGR
jgi:hypothetical protein